MSYIENLLGNPVLPEVQESLGLAAGNYKIKGFNIFILGSYAILSEGLALIDGLRVVSSANLQLPISAVYSKYIFLRIRTYTEVVGGNVNVQEELSLIAQTSNIPVNNDNLYEEIGTKDVLLAYVNSSGVVNLSTPGALIYYDIPSRILDLENDIKVGLSKGYWASYFDNTTQVSNLVVKPVEYNSTYFQYGITCVDKTKIRFGQAGTFDIHFSFVVENTTTHERMAEFWFRVNGTDLANTNTRVTLLKQANTIASWNFIHDANIGDEFEIMWYAPAGVQLRMYPAETAPTRPLVPSTIITITQVLYNQKSVPTGGTAGQVLAKIDGTDFNTEWVTKDTASLETRMTAVESVNTTQDTRLTNVETKNTEQDSRLAAIEGYTVLWQGAYHITDKQTITLSKSVTSQATGIIVVWSRYDSNPLNADWHYFFIPKFHALVHSGNGIGIVLRYTSTTIATKYLLIDNTTITGVANNGVAPNGNYVLRYVLGV